MMIGLRIKSLAQGHALQGYRPKAGCAMELNRDFHAAARSLISVLHAVQQYVHRADPQHGAVWPSSPSPPEVRTILERPPVWSVHTHHGMDKDAVRNLFDQQAAGYDLQWERLSPLRDCLHMLVQSLFAGLPEDARLLCVGAGTGAEIAFFARTFPRWRFTAVDPSGAMMQVCRQRAKAESFISRCSFHEGYIDSLPDGEPYDAATCFLVSQFLLDQGERTRLFGAIGDHLRPGGLLASTDLASDTASATYEALLTPWFTMMAAGGVDAEKLARMRANYVRDVAVLPPAQVASIIGAAGFSAPVQFFQAGLIHGWFARKTP